MRQINIVIVEDQDNFAQALKTAIEGMGKPNWTVRLLSPCRDPAPTFDEFFDEIEEASGVWGIILLDNHLGKWRWSGANLAPSLHNVISTSTEEHCWASRRFPGKAEIAIEQNIEAIALLQSILEQAEASIVPAGF